MMLLAERAGRKLERRSNSAPRGMTVTPAARPAPQNPAYRPASHFFLMPGRVNDQFIEDRLGLFRRYMARDRFGQFVGDVQWNEG